MKDRHIIVIGGGFAGFWAAAGAAAVIREAGAPLAVSVTVVSPTSTLSVRPRLYEPDLAPTVVDLVPLLEPIGVRLRTTTAVEIDVADLTVVTGDDRRMPFDAAVVAIGSTTPLPPIPGLDEHAHRIDVHHRAEAFRTALGAVRAAHTDARVTVVGGGLTGIELATELASDTGVDTPVDVTLVDGGTIGEPFGSAAREIVRAALTDVGVKLIDGERVVAASETTVALRSGAVVHHDLLVWCGGLVANQIGGLEAFERDDLDRLVADQHLNLAGPAPLWAAGDSARFVADGVHVAPMSCQFAIPSGRLAGRNAAAHILGLEPTPFDVERYVTCIDLGRAGALFTTGWDRTPVLTGTDGTRMKQFINRTAIYPPADPVAVLAAAADRGFGLGDPGITLRTIA